MTVTGATHSETARQVVHMSMGGFALLLRWIAWWQAVALAAARSSFNLFVLPRLRGAPLSPRRARARRPRHRLLSARRAAPARCSSHAGSTSSRRRGAFSPRATASRRSPAARSAARGGRGIRDKTVAGTARVRRRRRRSRRRGSPVVPARSRPSRRSFAHLRRADGRRSPPRWSRRSRSGSTTTCRSRCRPAASCGSVRWSSRAT